MLAIALAFFCLCWCTTATVIGIDFGTNTYKVMLVQGDFQIVLNEQSGRKTRSLIGFKGEERFFGAAAENAARWSPKDTFEYLRDLIGKDSLDSPSVKASLPFITYKDQLVETKAAEVDGSETGYNFLSVKRDDGVSLAIYELIAMILQDAKKMAEKASSGPVVDCSITVPVFFTQREREAIMEAATVAGLKVLSLVNQGTAFAIKYGIDMVISEPKNVLFFDLGQSSLQLTLVNFSSSIGKKNKTIPQLRVLATQWDTRVSGREMDELLLQYYVQQLQEKHAIDARSDPKLLSRLLSEVRKSREILSANKERPFVLEGVGSDIDFRASTTREEYELILADLLTLIKPNLDSLLATAKLTVSDIDAVEMVGGPMRIPKVQEIVKTYFSRENLDFHINADEGAVFGAAFYAAGFSAQHRVAEMKVSDATPWKVNVNISGIDDKHDGIDGTSAEKESGEETEAENNENIEKKGFKLITLFRSGNRYTAKKTLSFRHDVSKEFHIQVAYDQQQPLLPVPAGTVLVIDEFSFSAPVSIKKYNITGIPKVHVQFSLSSSGIISLVKAETELTISERKPITSAKEILEEIEKNEKIEGQNHDTQPLPETAEHENEKQPELEQGDQKSEPATGEQSTQEKNQNSQNLEIEYEDVTRIVRLPLTVVSSNKGQLPLSLKARAKKTLSECEARDKLRTETADAKNALEEYVYVMKEKIYDEDFISASTESEREKLSEELSSVGSWLEEDSGSKLQEYTSRKENLKKLAGKVIFRLVEKTRRPETLMYCVKTLNSTRNALKNITQKLEVTEEEVATVLKQVSDLENWLVEKFEEQEKLTLSQDPAFSSEQAEKKCKDVAAKGLKLTKKPKKKPPKPSSDKNKTKPDKTTSKSTEESTNSESSEPPENKTQEDSENNENTEYKTHENGPTEGNSEDTENGKPDL